MQKKRGNLPLRGTELLRKIKGRNGLHLDMNSKITVSKETVIDI